MEGSEELVNPAIKWEKEDKVDKVDGDPKTRRLQLHKSKEIGVKVGQRKEKHRNIWTEATKSAHQNFYQHALSKGNVPPIMDGHILRLNRAESRITIAPISDE